MGHHGRQDSTGGAAPESGDNEKKGAARFAWDGNRKDADTSS
jgi:hypothetical protein